MLQLSTDVRLSKVVLAGERSGRSAGTMSSEYALPTPPCCCCVVADHSTCYELLLLLLTSRPCSAT